MTNNNLIKNIEIAEYFRSEHLFFDSIKAFASTKKDKLLQYFVNVYDPKSVFVSFYGAKELKLNEACNLLMLVEKFSIERDVKITDASINFINEKVSICITCKINNSAEFLKESDVITLYELNPNHIIEINEPDLKEVEETK